MARYGNRFYTALVEHYFRMGVRYESVQGEAAKKWHSFITDWISELHEEDRNFIRFVFSRTSPNTDIGLVDFPGVKSFIEKRNWLDRLVTQFAVDAELISETQNK